MAKTVLKTFRFPLEVAKEIEVEAEKNHISQTQYVTCIIVENKFLKLKRSFEEDMKKLEKDDLYRKEQIDLAESDFL